MASANQYLERAASFIGVSGTDNIFNTWYWGFHCYDPNTYPWCAAFQSYIGVHELGMPFNASASAAGVANQGIRVADSEAQPGDWVLFNWDGRQDFGWADHIGVVEWSDINGSGYFGTIEGNTGATAGGEVARCTRYNWGSYGTAFFRPPYDGNAANVTPAAPAPAPQAPKDDNVHYCASTDPNGKIWLPEMIGTYDTGGSSDTFAGELGKSLRWIAIKGVGKYRVATERHPNWLEYVDAYNKNDLEYGCAGDGSPIIALEIPNKSVRYAVRDLNGNWNADMVGNSDTGGSADFYAGSMRAIDAAKIMWA